MKTQTLGLSLAVMFLAATAFADTRIAILPVGGPGGAKAEAAMRKALGKRKDVELIPASAIKAAIKKHGRKVDALAKALNADVVFVSLTAKAGKNMKLNVGVYDAEGQRVGGNGWQLKKGDMKQVETSLWAELAPSMKKAGKSSADDAEEEKEETKVAKKEEPAKEKEEDSPRKEAADDAFEDEKAAAVAKKEEPKKEEKTVEEAEEKEEPKKVAAVEKREEEKPARRSDPSEDVRDSDESNETTVSSSSNVREAREPSAFGDLDAEIGMHAFTRSFSYNQPLLGSLASYRLSSGPAIAGGAEWYAGALAGEGFAGNLGVSLLAESAFGIGSQAADGSRVATSAYAFDVGPRVRIPLSGHKLSVGAGYGTRVFAVADTEDAVLSMVPDVSYRYVSVRAGGRYNVSDQLSVNAKFAYLHLLGTGELGTDRFFPRLSGAGIEAAAFVGYEVTPRWEVRVGVDMTRFFFALKPEPGDANVAGGAVDQFFAGTARIAYSL